MELSVVIVSYNVRDFLKQSLLSVIKASEQIDCEIFVVDNNSQDGSVDMVRKEYPEVRLIINNFNPGFSAANNQAINQAKGKYLLLLNPDTLVEEEAFSKSIDFMDRHADAGALGVRMVDGEGKFLPESKRAIPTLKSAFFKIFGFSRLFPRSSIFNQYYLSHINSFETSRSEVISGAFMFIRREALNKTGLLDEEYFMYGEDIDLSYRLLQAGYKNYYFPEVRIVHFKGKSTCRDNYTDIHHFYRAMIIFIRKRNAENFNPLYSLAIPAIYFRQGIALIRRYFRILIRI